MSIDTPALYELENGIAVISLDHPPVNALALVVRLHLQKALLKAQHDNMVQAIVIQGLGRGFSGGGDITEFDLPAALQSPIPGDLFTIIEDSLKPIVASMHGMALGGGLELALACHGRVVQKHTLIGLPEVHLGLVPGAGGTQRLPRLVNPELALSLITQGKTYKANLLADSDLFDAVTDDGPLHTAIELAHTLVNHLVAGGSLKRTGQQPAQMNNAQAFFAYARATVTAQFRGLPAPIACVDCVENAFTMPFKQGLTEELSTFNRLRSAPEFSGLRHIFLADRKSTEIHDLDRSIKANVINRAVVVGAGTMGTGIAICFINAGIPVTLIEREQAALDRGLATIDGYLASRLKKDKLTQNQIDKLTPLINGTINFDVVKEADIVIEAVFEDLDIKRQVFQQIDQLARPGAILATNTSMLDLDQIASFTKRPQDVIGLHFFSPAHIMKLLEVVRGAHTSPVTLATAMTLARRLGKTAVLSGVCEGFIGNRMFEAYLMQAGLLLDEGALPEQIDHAIENWGMAMGPFRVCDMAGNDLGAKIRQQRVARDSNRIYSRTMDCIVERGRYGQKVGRGWYDYSPTKRGPQPSDEVKQVILDESARLGLERRNISDKEIVDRLLLSLVNEGSKILAEGIAQRASDIDVVYTSGYGFPRWRGGPMFAADQRGLSDVQETMCQLQKGHDYQYSSEFWKASDLLSKLAANNRLFGTYNLSEHL